MRTLYHGTSIENLESIRSQGLKASRPKGVNFALFDERGGEHPGVSLADNKITPFCYGNTVVEVFLPDDADTTVIPTFYEILVNHDLGPECIGRAWFQDDFDIDWIEEAIIEDYLRDNPDHIPTDSKFEQDGIAYVKVIRAEEVK